MNFNPIVFALRHPVTVMVGMVSLLAASFHAQPHLVLSLQRIFT